MPFRTINIEELLKSKNMNIYEKNHEQNGVEKAEELQNLANKQFGVWNNALLSKDANKVAALYVDGASFLPTLNPEFKKGKDGAANYFHHFLEKNPEGKVVEEMVQEISSENGQPKSFIHSGMYNFEVGEADHREIAEARFTFVWSKNKDGQWEILHHHSSLVPGK